jgi:uncharacterized protein YbaR (Trm112 family)
MNPELLQILRCPETHQALEPVDAALLAQINERIRAGLLANRAGEPIHQTIDGGLIRADRRCLYPIRDEIPVLLVEEAIVLPVI